jgi:peptide/nickel transport system ATP-binding protein/oligopeptide transport system ATP-binding protein
VMVMYVGQVVESGSLSDVFIRPRHPYTVGLLDSARIGPERGIRKSEIRGEPVSPLNPPSGCRFRTRCWKAQEICTHVAPPLLEVSPGSLAACHFPENVSHNQVNSPLLIPNGF